MLNRRAILAAPPALLASAALPNAGHAAEGQWSREPDMPWPVQEVYGAALDGQAVLVGGMVVRGGHSEAVDRVALYDPAGHRWREGPRLPEARHHAAVVAMGRRLYAIGGARHGMPGEPAGAHWRQCSDVFMLEGGLWTRGPSLPVPQSEAVAIAYDKRIHLVTGRTPRSPSATTWDEQRDVNFHQVLDTGTGRWTFAAPPPTARNSAGGGMVGGRLYVAGGRTMEGGNLDRLEMYDPVADRWEVLRPMPSAAGGVAATVFRDRLYVFGGERLGQKGLDGVIGAAWGYDPARDVWDALPDMPTPRHGLAAVALSDRILLAGGGALPATARTTAITETLKPRGCYGLAAASDSSVMGWTFAASHIRLT